MNINKSIKERKTYIKKNEKKKCLRRINEIQVRKKDDEK